MAQRPIIAGLDAGTSTTTFVLDSRREPRIHSLPSCSSSGSGCAGQLNQDDEARLSTPQAGA